MKQGQCKECGCTTGGGEYCFQHAPYTVFPLKDGTFRSNRHGLKRIWFDEPPLPTPWQPIETAPQVHPLNGGESLLLAWIAPGINEWIFVVGEWRNGWFSGEHKAYPTLWQRIQIP